MNISNEEKAKEIYCRHCLNNGFNKCKKTCTNFVIGVMKLTEMAEWKDSQIPDCGVIINSEMYKSVAVDCDTCEHCDLESYCKRMNELKCNTEQPCKLFGKGRIFKKVK